MEELNQEIVSVLKKAKFGQNLTINWRNCTITSSEIDSRGTSLGKIQLQTESDAQMIKDLETKLRNIKTILAEQIERAIKNGEYRRPEKGTQCSMCLRIMPNDARKIHSEEK